MNSFLSFANKNSKKISDKIDKYLISRNVQEHYKIVQEYPNRGSGYIRPAFVFLSVKLHSGKEKDALLPAVAIQLFQEFAIIHDDVEDNGKMRRGLPALHKIYGNAQAINAGDHLHMEMWNVLKDYIKEEGVERGIPIYEKFYDIVKSTIEWQHVDLSFTERRGNISTINESAYYKLADKKSAYYSVYGPLQIGMLCSWPTPDNLTLLEEIGKPAGIAAQIQDDILDFEGSKDFGKNKYQDLYEGKPTLIVLHTLSSANTKEKRHITKIYSKIPEEKTKEDIYFLIDMIRKHKGIEYAKSKRDRFGERAESLLRIDKSRFNHNYVNMFRDALILQYRRST